MPIYEYRCADCGYQNEFLQKVSEPPMKVCPACGKASFTKLLSVAGFQLKGSGWYATDFKGGAAKPAKDKPEAKPEAKSEAKPETKSDASAESRVKAVPASGKGASSTCTESASN
jgi:putative FmdB family regulatory protein